MVWILILIIFLILLFLVLRYRSLYLREKFRKNSISVKHGKFIEHYIPWIKEVFPYNPNNFRFIGDPVDGVLFDENEIVFLEFKTGKSKLTNKQRKIKNLVKEKKVAWKEIKVS